MKRVILTMVISMKSKKKYTFFIVFFILLILGTYYFVLRDYSFLEFKNSLADCNLFYIGLSFSMLILFVLSGSLFLKRMLHYFEKKITWRQAIGYLATEVYFSAITPSSTGGQPVQMYEMNKDGIKVRTSSVVVLLNTILYKLALILLAFLIVPFYLLDIFNISNLFSILIILGLIVNIFVVILFISMVYSRKVMPKIIKSLISFGYKIHIIQDKSSKLEKFNNAIMDYKKCSDLTKKRPIILLEGLFYMLIQRMSIFAISFFIYSSFGLNSYSFFCLVAFQICITLASDFVPLPGGVGVSESLLLKVNEVIYGTIFATSGMILFRGISFYIFFLLGGVFYLIFHFTKRQ